MLRAVRFAATFAFELDADTLAAIRQSAGGITIVSAERIAEEMRRMIVHEHRVRALRMLKECELLAPVIPPLAELVDRDPLAWEQTLALLDECNAEPNARAFHFLLAAMLRRSGAASGPRMALAAVASMWRLSSDENSSADWLLAHLDEAHAGD